MLESRIRLFEARNPCLNHSEKTACNPEQERRWGYIWHTEADRLDKLNQLYPGRLRTQLNAVTELLFNFLTSDKSLRSTSN